MKKINKLKIAGVLIFAIGVMNFGITAQRPRVIISDMATPAPTVTPTPTETPVPIQTLPFLQSRFRISLNNPEARRGHIGVKVVSLDSGKTIFEENSEKYFMPASNMKVVTVAAALEKLSPSYRFTTSVYAPAMPDGSGTIKGDLTIYGRGDISISTAFNDGDYYKSLDDLADKIAQAGVKRIDGNLIGDESYFRGNPIPASWEWDDLQWYYGAEISALSLNDNAIDFSVKPGSNGSACIAKVEPENVLIRVINRCITSGGKRTLQVTKKLDQHIIEISGTMPANDNGFRGSITVSQPAKLFIELLRQRLQQKGITVTGQNLTVNTANNSASERVEIAKLQSPPLSIIAQKTMKPSQNLYTETLLWTLGEEAGDKSNPNLTSQEKGVAVVKKFLQDIGIPSDSIIQWDGSGLSRHNLVTPNSIVKIYEYMSKSRTSLAFGSSLTIGGVDGTLKNRFRGTSAEANVRGKTGTIDQVSSLSGYVNSASGERFVFSIIVNGVNNLGTRKEIIDDMVVAIANFNGKTD